MVAAAGCAAVPLRTPRQAAHPAAHRPAQPAAHGAPLQSVAIAILCPAAHADDNHAERNHAQAAERHPKPVSVCNACIVHLGRQGATLTESAALYDKELVPYSSVHMLCID